jgi:putative transposase
VPGHVVSLTAEFELPELPLPKADSARVVGIDVGLKDFLVLSNGARQAPPKHYRAAENKLRRAQRKLSRKVKGGRNHEKARRQLARIHQKVRAKRQDFSHKLSTSLIQNWQAVCVEGLALKGLARTKLAKSFSDAAFGEFKWQLGYKAAWHRKHLVEINRWFPSSKLCGDCGTVSETLTLADRVWACQCGEVHDRDLNAARNIRNEGLRILEAAGHADSLNACGAGVRLPDGEHPAMKQESPR